MNCKRIRRAAYLCAVIFAGVTGLANRLAACGPDFPNSLLDGGTNALLTAPKLNFARELERMHLATAAFAAVPATNEYGLYDYARQTMDAEQVDLKDALRVSGTKEADVTAIADDQLVERYKLKQFSEAYESWSGSLPPTMTPPPPVPVDSDTNIIAIAPVPPAPVFTQPPTFPTVKIVDGLPAEFGDYMDGVIAWDNPSLTNKDICRQVWERLLARPATERHYKSTAAAYMLGRSWETEDPDKAISYYLQVRVLAKQGFADSAGLAAASLGREALVNLDQRKYHEALQLYLQQWATGDRSAAISLNETARKALADPDPQALVQLAADPKDQRVITAYVISTDRAMLLYAEDDTREGQNAATEKWLTAVEAAGAQDVESAEKLALAAYRAGDWDAAQRWVDRAPDSPVAEWIQVKLWLRAGKMDQAAELLAKLSHSFPVAVPETNAPTKLEDNLVISGSSYAADDITGASQVQAELGVLHLARREYTEALDSLLRAGYWMDAAYVAERVLAVDELKAYVDANWPENVGVTNGSDGQPGTWTYGFTQVEYQFPKDLRYLLARRLTRMGQMAEAREYYPVEWRESLDNLSEELAKGHDTTLTAKSRFDALVAAAMVTRTNGMELMGTEVGPDWHISDGDFEIGVSVDSRSHGPLPVTDDEMIRATENHPDPEQRYHYRALAAELNVEAARLGWELVPGMPDNSDETAHFLCEAGDWLVGRDPKLVNQYYLAIIHRCRNTDIGAEAARTGQIPELDDGGKVVPRYSKGEDTPQAGKFYTVHAGDTLNHIAEVVGQAGVPLTVADILQANPKVLSPDKIRAGQVIFLPGDGMTARSPEEQPANPPLPNNPPPDNMQEQNGGQTMIQGTEYEVQAGDTLAKIAQTFGVSVGDLLAVNQIDGRHLLVGQVIVIPQN